MAARLARAAGGSAGRTAAVLHAHREQQGEETWSAVGGLLSCSSVLFQRAQSRAVSCCNCLPRPLGTHPPLPICLPIHLPNRVQVVPSDDPTTRFIRVYCPLGMADVFGATPAGDSRVLVDCGHGSCTEIDRAAVLPTGVMTWRGSKLSVPGDVPAALEQRYGPDWHVPRYMVRWEDCVFAFNAGPWLYVLRATPLPPHAAAVACRLHLQSCAYFLPPFVHPVRLFVAGQGRRRGGGAEAVCPHLPSAVQPGHPHLRGEAQPDTCATMLARLRPGLPSNPGRASSSNAYDHSSFSTPVLSF